MQIPELPQLLVLLMSIITCSSMATLEVAEWLRSHRDTEVLVD